MKEKSELKLSKLQVGYFTGQMQFKILSNQCKSNKTEELL